MVRKRKSQTSELCLQTTRKEGGKWQVLSMRACALCHINSWVGSLSDPTSSQGQGKQEEDMEHTHTLRALGTVWGLKWTSQMKTFFICDLPVSLASPFQTQTQLIVDTAATQSITVVADTGDLGVQ